MTSKKRLILSYGILALLLAVLFAANLFWGSVSLTPGAVLAALTGRGQDALSVGIITQLRLPRAVMVVLLGAALSAAGYLLQTFFANPIAGPFVMGISSGAKLAVALVMVLFLNYGLLTSSAVLILAAFAGAMAAMAFVLAVACDEPLWWGGPQYRRADQIAQEASDWQRLSGGSGAKGERLYDWALLPVWRLQVTPQEQRWGHYLLVRRSLTEPKELAYYVVFALKERADLPSLVKVAARRWEIEVGFEAAKGECGLDQYEVRRWHSWYRHITLSLLAHAVLSVVSAGEKKNTAGADGAERAGVAQVAHAAGAAGPARD